MLRLATVQHITRSIALTLAVLSGAWALWLAFFGGFDLKTPSGLVITTHNPWHPAVGAATGLALFLIARGRWVHLRSWFASLAHINDRTVVLGLAAVVCAIGIAYATTVGGGADAYGYVSQADLWLKGHLKTPQEWVQQVPWPSSRWSFTPLGYRPGLTDADVWSIVPVYSPGLPLLMAGAKFVGGQEGMFWVVPILGGLLVLATFGIGARLGSPRAGLVGALLVATSPAFLFMLMTPMTDVAVAGTWMIAFYFLLGESRGSAFAAGLASALAILIRPNLTFEGGVLGLWYLLRAWRSGEWQREITRGLLFASGMAPGVAAVALINTYLFGSPFISGYGRFADSFTRANVLPNAARYASWFVYAHSPAAVIGVVPLVAPLRWFWPRVKDRLIFVIIGAFISLLLLEFFSYLEFDAWWYLRFVLPGLPFVMLGIGAIVAAFGRLGRVVISVAAVVFVAWLCIRDFALAGKEFTFDLWRGDLRYVAVAQLTRQLTDESSVVYTMQHSGSLRYYGGRLTARYDEIDDDWQDRSIAWFESRGVHPYLLLEEWEIPPFKKQWAHANAVAYVDSAPILLYEGGARIFLWDLASSRNLSPKTVTIAETYVHRRRSTRPAPFPAITLGK